MTRLIQKQCKTIWVLLLAATLQFVYPMSAANAEYFGLYNGRSANVSTMPDKSVEFGFMTGDIADVSYVGFGGRFNFRVAPDFMMYVDIGKAEIRNDDGTTYGAGFFYQIQGVMQTADLAFKGSYHKANAEDDSGVDDPVIIVVEALISGKKLGESNLSWYTNIGIHKFDVADYDETEIGFGGGIFSPTSFGEFYAGVDIIDELTFGLGVRYFLQ